MREYLRVMAELFVFAFGICVGVVMMMALIILLASTYEDCVNSHKESYHEGR